MADLEPEGESLRRAVRWISDTRTANPGSKLAPIIEEAALRFDLSPLESDFIWRLFTAPQANGASKL